MDYVEKGQKVVLQELVNNGTVMILTINRPHAKNSVNDWVYNLLIEGLEAAKNNKKVSVVILTGAKDFFCGGADLKAGFDPFKGPLKSGKGSLLDPVGRFMSAVIAFPKILVAAVNGPGVGIGATIIPHCDVVYAVETAQFWTPFTQIAVTPEFCSSLTFPAIMGTSLASEVLFFGRKLTAQDALRCGFITDILPADNFIQNVIKKVAPSLEYPNSDRSLLLFKRLVRTDAKVAELERVHAIEMKLLDERSTGDNSEAATALKFMQQQAKQKSKI